MKASHIRATVSTASIVSCLFFAVGVAGAQSISNTGADSSNVISSTNKCDTTVTNTNNVDVTNNNPQNATSGDSESDGNTTSGSVGSGDASNSSNTSVTVGVDNTSAGGCAPAETPTVTPVANPEQPSGGRGGGQPAAANTPQVVAAPVGGVGAGAGGPGALGGLVALSLASGALAAVRIRSSRNHQA